MRGGAQQPVKVAVLTNTETWQVAGLCWVDHLFSAALHAAIRRDVGFGLECAVAFVEPTRPNRPPCLSLSFRDRSRPVPGTVQKPPTQLVPASSRPL